jgi:hypothetical protein
MTARRPSAARSVSVVARRGKLDNVEPKVGLRLVQVGQSLLRLGLAAAELHRSVARRR